MMMSDEPINGLQVVDDNRNIYLDDGSCDDGDLTEYSPEQASNLRNETRKLVLASDAAIITMSGNLYEIRRNKLFKAWGYEKFRDYVETELAISIRKAEYLLQIWHKLVEELGEGSTKILDKVKVLGITKIKECLNVFTRDNIDQVIEQVKELSVRKVAEIKKEIAISEHLHKGEDDSATSDDEADDLGAVHQRMSFKLYPDQFKAVSDALELAGGIGNSKCKNTQLRYIADEFLTLHAEGDVERNRIAACQRFEKSLGVLVFVASASDGKIIYGADIEERLAQLVGDKHDDKTSDQPSEG